MGYIVGTVTQSGTGTPIQGAVVSAGSSSALTDSSGKYNISIPAGTYDVTASKTGYTPSTQTGKIVTVGHETTVDFQLAGPPTPVFPWNFPAIIMAAVLMVAMLSLLGRMKKRRNRSKDPPD
jgi:hypothetical protein